MFGVLVCPLPLLPLSGGVLFFFSFSLFSFFKNLGGLSLVREGYYTRKPKPIGGIFDHWIHVRSKLLSLLRGADELRKVVTLGPGSSQSRTASFLGRALTLRQWRIEYEPDQQHVSRALMHTHLRREVYTHSAVARTFFCTVLRTFTHLHACTFTHGSSVRKGLLHLHVASLHLAFSSLMFHLPLLLSPDGHFETIPDIDVHDFLAELYPTQKRGSRELPQEHRGVWLPPLAKSSLHTLESFGIDRVLGSTTWVGLRPAKSVSCVERQNGTILGKESERKMIFSQDKN